MNRELRLLNLICIAGAVLFLLFIVVNAVTSNDVLSTDNLFVTTVCLVMALVFAVNPLLYLKSEGKLSLPFTKKTVSTPVRILGATAPPPALLDAKGRAVPPDVRAIVSQMGQAKMKDA